MTLLELLHLLRRHIKLVIILPLVCALAAGVYGYLLTHDVYTASTSMYVLAKDLDSTNTSLSSDLSASQMISNDVAVLLDSDRVRNETAEDLGLDSLKGYDTSIASDTTSRVITLSVTGADPQTAADFANAMTSNVSEIAREVMEVESVNAIDRATPPTSPSGPNRPLYVAVALLGGLFLAVAVVVVEDMLNTRVRSDEEVEELLGIPVIGHVPAMGGR